MINFVLDCILSCYLTIERAEENIWVLEWRVNKGVEKTT